jgi:GntP family gluconate:H+ symporter
MPEVMDALWLLGIGMAIVVGGIIGLRLHPFLALVLAALVVGSLTPQSSLERYAQDKKMAPAQAEKFLDQSTGSRVAAEFGNTCANIGILIALAAVIGKFLLDSGGADRIVRSAIRWLGEPRAPLAFLGSGFLLGIPVFFDTVFYLLIPLGKALRIRTGRHYALYVMSIIAGATMSHSLVPPTPGPLYVATQLGVSIGMMMLGGIAVGSISSLAGYAYAVWLDKRLDVPLRDTAHSSLAELTAITERDERELPPLWLSLLPIALPVFLIGGNALLRLFLDPVTGGRQAAMLAFMGAVGDPVVALALAVAASLALLFGKKDARAITTAIESGLTSGALIILITAAGGAFGGILQQTGVGHRIESLATTYQIGILPLAWFVTALVRTVQGSATVAMFTAVGILGGMVHSAELGFHPVYVALAIGCGSKPFPWMNDSGFWLINRMAGMTVGETIKSFSFLQCVMSLSGFAVVLLLARFFPLV